MTSESKCKQTKRKICVNKHRVTQEFSPSKNWKNIMKENPLRPLHTW